METTSNGLRATFSGATRARVIGVTRTAERSPFGWSCCFRAPGAIVSRGD
jgi:hypothetical protein